MRRDCVRVAIFAASAVFTLSVSGACYASCGGYVYSRFHTPDEHRQSLNEPAKADGRDLANSEFLNLLHHGSGSSNSTPALPAPCYGANCSQNPTPLVPFAPPTSTGDSSQDRLIFGRLAIELPSTLCRLEDMESGARARRGFPLLIEVPPEIVG